MQACNTRDCSGKSHKPPSSSLLKTTMFKNLILYRIQSLPLDVMAINESMQSMAFIPCGPSQGKSAGWVPPRAEHGLFLESVGGHWIAKLMIETKAVPSDVVRRELDKRKAEIEQQTGRKPGKKESRDIVDEIWLSMMPHAFPKQASILVWIDPTAMTLVIDTSSQAKADGVVTALVQSIPGLELSLVSTRTSPSTAMAEWLSSREAPAGFSIDRECELKACDESKAVVRYSKHSLDISEVPGHIHAGKMPTKLAMTWNDRVSFVLTAGLEIKKLEFLDVVFEGAKEGQDDGFDADVAIATGELTKLIPDLIDALGGLAQLD